MTLDQALAITKAILVGVSLYLLAEAIRPGMMLIPDTSNAVTLYRLELVTILLKSAALLLIALELAYQLLGKRSLVLISCAVFLLLNGFLLKSLFIFW